jgi:hypothetical protein
MRLSVVRLAPAFVFIVSLLPALAEAQAPAAPPAAAPPAQADKQNAPSFSKEQLEQLLAPIALYPDSLLSQVLMAATYPSDVADAAKWSKANPNQKGDDAVKAVQSQSWDPSVMSLVAFPQVLDMMGAQPDWVQNLGDAFLASSKDVLDAVQRLRAKAQQAGNLKSSDQQKVIVEQEPQTQQTVIKVEPANPQTVYVPAYNPTVVYGSWPYPAYPPMYYPPPPYYYPGGALASGIMFGIGVAAVGSLWGGCNWGHGDVNVNVNKYNNINSNRKLNANQTSFQHNAANRRGVPYRDQASRQQYGRDVGGSAQRADYRGRDAGRDAQRQQAQSSLQGRGMDPAQGRQDLRNDPGTRDRAQAAAQGTGRDRAGGGQGGVDRGGGQGGIDRGGGQGGIDRGGAGGAAGGGIDRGGSAQGRGGAGAGGGGSAFSGAGNPGQSRQQIDRGNASRSSMSQSRGGGGGGGRGGGGGGGGGRRR